MPLETATYISQLVSTNPAHTDQLNLDDSHMRLVKSALLATFPGFTAAALASSQAQLDGAVTAVGSLTNAQLAGTVTAIGSLTNAQLVAACDATAWTAYTPVVAYSDSHTGLVYTATGRYKKIGKSVFLNTQWTVTSWGTGASASVALKISLPFAAFSAFQVINGYNGNGDGLQGSVNLQIRTSDVNNAQLFVVANNLTLGNPDTMMGVYEAA